MSLREIAPGFHFDFPGAVGDLVEENQRLRGALPSDLVEENRKLRASLSAAHAALAKFNAQRCGPRTAFVFGFVLAGGRLEDAARLIGET